MKNQNLNPEDVNRLRRQSLISENEFAYKAGDLIIAENPMSGEKRIIGNVSLLNEVNKRVLKG